VVGTLWQLLATPYAGVIADVPAVTIVFGFLSVPALADGLEKAGVTSVAAWCHAVDGVPVVAVVSALSDSCSC
jgi:hypothetical protein